jgi:hypothetical protein
LLAHTHQPFAYCQDTRDRQLQQSAASPPREVFLVGFVRADAKSLGLRPKPQFLVRFGGFAAKTNQKNLVGRRSLPTPTAEADFATALVGFVGEADKTNQKLYNQ